MKDGGGRTRCGGCWICDLCKHILHFLSSVVLLWSCSISLNRLVPFHPNSAAPRTGTVSLLEVSSLDRLCTL